MAGLERLARRHGGPQRRVYRTLEQNCLATGTLPSLAYGWRSCSDKYKRRPQDKYVNQWGPAREAWSRGEKGVNVPADAVDSVAVGMGSADRTARTPRILGVTFEAKKPAGGK